MHPHHHTNTKARHTEAFYSLPSMSAPDHVVADHEAPSSSTCVIDEFLAPLSKGTRGNKSPASHRSSQAAGRSRPSSGETHCEDNIAVSIFDVPPGLLTRAGREEGSLHPPHLHAGSPAQQQQQPAAPADAASAAAVKDVVSKHRGLTCLRCGLSFTARPAQLAHFKSDLHMTNLRRQLSGKPPISEDQLNSALKAAGSSTAAEDEEAQTPLSREEDSSSGTESDEATTTSAGGTGVELEDVLEGGVLTPADGVVGLASAPAEEQMGNARGRVKFSFSLREGPRLTFIPTCSKWEFSLSNAALGMERGDDPWARLDGFAGEEAGGGNRLWAVVILRSGKFAAGVFEGQSVLCHKVFRRYTIRAKRGGSQSSYDSGGRKAQSAGAALRRYGEQALREDTRALLKEWEGPLKACRVVLTSVPKGMRTVLFDGKDAPFDRKDPRLRPIPFAVGKPVFEEVVAVHARVTSVIFSDAAVAAAATDTTSTSNDPAAEKNNAATLQGGGASASSTKQAANKKETAAAAAAGGAKVGPDSQAAEAAEPCPPSTELIEACERGDVDAAIALLDRLDVNDDGPAPDSTGSGGGTAAAVAAPPLPPPPGAAINQGAVQGASSGWTAREVIDHPDGLERLMTPLHVAAAGGHVAVLGALLERGADPLAEDVRGRVPYLLAANKDTRDAFRRARAGQPERWDWDAARVPEPLTEELEQRRKEKLKEKEKEKKRRAKLRKKEEKSKAEEEERQRKAKEDAEAEDRRARGLAAVGHCDACGKLLVDKRKAFSRFEFRYCSSDCANLHKRKLAADAAERRLNGGT